MPASTIGKPVSPAFHASNTFSAAASGVHVDRVEVAVPVPPRAVRPVVRARRHRSRETPARADTPRGPCGDRRGRRPCPRVNGAELQVRRHSAGTVHVGPVAVLGVVVEGVVAKARPLSQGRLLARRDIDLNAGIGDLDRALEVCRSSQRGRGRARAAGARHPTFATGRRTSVNTLYGLPSSLVTRPGETRYGEPAACSVISPSASRTCSSRLRPNGVKSSETNTADAPMSLAISGIRFSGRPRVTKSRPSRSSRSCRSESHMNCSRRRPTTPPVADRARRPPARRRRPRIKQRWQVPHPQVAAEPQQGWHRCH